jgi:hypothetical protein
MIKNAKDISLNQNTGTLPDVSAALLNWLQPMQVKQITKKNVNFSVVETVVLINFEGVVENQSPEQIMYKPEGQRSWKWVAIWTLATITLNVDDIVTSLGKTYRIKNKSDWYQYGYINYEAVEDWT